MSERQGWSKIARRIRVPLGFIFAALYLWLAQPTWTSIVFGASVAACGVLLRGAASGHVKKNEELATTGPYTYTRNPLYLGSILIGAGFALASCNWWVPLGLVMLFTAIYIPVIRAEEDFLRTRFANFDDYASRVPRLVPRPWVQKHHIESIHGSFSWDLYLKHREYNAAIGTAAMLAALVAKLMWVRT